MKLKEEFLKNNKNSHINFISSSSGKLLAQIQNNAPYDIFMSANMKYPEALYKSKHAIGRPIVYAKGRLAIFSKDKQDFSLGISLVLNKDVHKIAIANPDIAPYGLASIEALESAKLYKDIKQKLVYTHSVSQTMLYSSLIADIGFIASSSLYSPKMRNLKQGVDWEFVDAKLYTPIDQGIVLLQKSQSNTLAKEFYSFVLSKRAKSIFKSFGYLVYE